MENRDIFIKCVCASVVLHTFAIYGTAGINFAAAKRHRQPEVTYQKVQQKLPLEVPRPPDEIKLTRQKEQEEQPKQAQVSQQPKQELKSDSLKNVQQAKKESVAPVKKAQSKLVKIKEKRPFTTSPAFLTYNNFIREKIRKKAVALYDRPDEQGNVYISFTLEKSGALKMINVVTERSTGNEYLKRLARSSIIDSSPFPQLPEEVDQPELTFSVMMSFRAGTVSSR